MNTSRTQRSEKPGGIPCHIESLSRTALSFWNPAEAHHSGVHSDSRDDSRSLTAPRRLCTSTGRRTMRLGFAVSRETCDRGYGAC